MEYFTLSNGNSGQILVGKELIPTDSVYPTLRTTSERERVFAFYPMLTTFRNENARTWECNVPYEQIVELPDYETAKEYFRDRYGETVVHRKTPDFSGPIDPDTGFPEVRPGEWRESHRMYGRVTYVPNPYNYPQRVEYIEPIVNQACECVPNL